MSLAERRIATVRNPASHQEGTRSRHTGGDKQGVAVGGVGAGGLEAADLLDLCPRHLAVADGDVGVLGQVLARAAVVVDAVPLLPRPAGQHAVRVQPAPAEERRRRREPLRGTRAEQAQRPDPHVEGRAGRHGRLWCDAAGGDAGGVLHWGVADASRRWGVGGCCLCGRNTGSTGS